jgi:GH25 family lysozyme M1 (1,4-beta-N-acetylmuramidase)/uncharacterized protein YraI
MANVIGPDVSFYQDDVETARGINFETMRRAAEYVIIRAGQNLWPDPDFKYNWRAAKLAGLPRGSYWFYDSRANPKRQAELWVQGFEGDLGELPLFADFEESYGGPYAGWGRWYDFLERLKTLVGDKQIAIYTAYYYWARNAPSVVRQPQQLEYFHQYPLWIANYGATKPLVPKPWAANEWLFWQYSETGDGRLYGVESRGIDLNYFNGDVERFRERFRVAAPEPPPPPPTGSGRTYLVTTRLKVRNGPATDAGQVGSLDAGDTVEELGANHDRSWLQIIRRLDNLSGWSSAAYLTPIGGPPPPAPTPSGRQFRVTTRLRVREGPGTTFPTINVLDTGDVVDELGATGDRTWLKIIRRRDGLTGWSMSDYLEGMENPTPPPPLPVPVEEAWYRVTGTTLTVRSGPGLSFSSIGTLRKDDTVAGSAASADKAWIQIRRLDGLTGWCFAGYLALLGNTRPKSVRQLLFPGTTYFRKELVAPRNLVIHVLAIDLQAAKIEFLVTPAAHAGGILCTSTTSQFAATHGTHIAINGDGFSYLQPTPDAEKYCPGGSDPVQTNGFAASQGRIYSTRKGPTLYISQFNEVTFGREKGRIHNAISGDRMVLAEGKSIPTLPINGLHPRTAIGLTRNGRTLFLMVVDGRQSGYSDGVDLAELAKHLISFGAYTGINMDGGGSSTMAIRTLGGKQLVLNSPIDSNVAGKERGVANHLGLFFR